MQGDTVSNIFGCAIGKTGRKAVEITEIRNKIIEYVKEVDFRLADGLIKIYEREIPSKFSRGVFDVIGQKSLSVEIEELLERKKNCADPLEKAKIVKEIGIKKGLLNEYKSKYVIDKKGD